MSQAQQVRTVGRRPRHARRVTYERSGLHGYGKKCRSGNSPRSCVGLRLTAGAGLLNRRVASARSTTRIETDDTRLVVEEGARAGRSRSRIGIGRELRARASPDDVVAGLAAASQHAI